MKRDMELVRLILAKMEEQPTYPSHPDLKDSGYSVEEIHYHYALLTEAGLIIAIDASGGKNLTFIPQRLTWQGHEFLEATKNNDAWSKTKEIMAKSGGFVFEVAKAVLLQIITQQ